MAIVNNLIPIILFFQYKSESKIGMEGGYLCQCIRLGVITFVVAIFL